MTILSSNIRLLESERMTDTSDGGGRRTNRVIPDGVAGNVFPKVSRVDSVYGRVNLRKIYPHINTATLDVYAGAHFIITDAPDNDRISVLAFSTGSDFDLRADARDRIESYVIAGPESRASLYGRQLQGSQAILLYQRAEEPLPEVGEVYAISNESGSVTSAQQFVRVQDVTHEVRTFTDDQGGEFQRRVVTLKIGSPLRYEFTGLPGPSRFSSAAAGAPGRLRSTTVADAARYYGIQPVTSAVSSGALELTLASVYAPIVPTTQRESALSLASIAGAVSLQSAASSALAETLLAGVQSDLPSTYQLRSLRAVKLGSMRVRVLYFNPFFDGRVATDWVAVGIAGAFSFVGTDGRMSYFNGTLDHESGQMSINLAPVSNGDVEVEYIPAVQVQQTAHTKAIEVTLATRGTVYAVPLVPLPAPGTLIVECRSLGKWYRLRDSGTGELVGGDTAYGTGSVDYVTGGATVTLGALPDVGSSVLMSWGSPVHFEMIVPGSVSPVFQAFVLQGLPIKPGSVALAYMSGSTPYTVTESGGVFTGGGVTGTVDYITGECRVNYGTVAPNADSAVSVTYTQLGPVAPGAPTVQALEFPLSAGAIATGRSWTAGSVVVYASIIDPDGVEQTIQLRDDGTGVLRTAGIDERVGWSLVTGTIIATINYATGLITVTGPVQATRQVQNLSGTGTSFYVTANTSHPLIAAQTALVSGATGAAAVDIPQTLALTLGLDSALQIDLTSNTRRSVVPGSVMFTLGGKTYIDRNGTLYTDVSPTTGSGTVRGAIDYNTGLCTLTDWVDGATLALSLKAGLLVRGVWTASQVSFRTAGSPLRSASLYVQCTAADGELLSGTADQSGLITGGMVGLVEQTMGVVNIVFPKQVLPGTLRYSAVVLSNLPLDADVLGLDPVRLPSDGRVPIFRPADVVVLHHTGTFNAGTPSSGAVINVGRTDLSALWLEDANRKKLADSMYAPDLAAGTATMAAGLSLAGYVPPIAARHRIEEMGLLSDVQINGQVSLSAPTLRAFPSGSYLSSALLYGDLQGRATNLFDQQTWTSVWQSTVIGNGATAQYNDIDYPVEVLNSGAITERWRLSFTAPTSFQIIGENLGVIGVGSTSADVQPLNALTGQAYFTLRAAGFGTGWAAGNQLRFDTISAAPPTWLARTVLPGAALTGDSFDAQLRGDVD
jgi:hypothetical protein